MKKQSGFAVVEAIVVLVIVGAIAGVGYSVWNRDQRGSANTKQSATGSQTNNNQNDDVEAGLGKGCTAGTMQGKLFTAPKAVYSICVPNGWRLNNYQTILDSNAGGLVYTANVAPQLTANGHDGVSAFSLSYNEPAAGAPSLDDTYSNEPVSDATGRYNAIGPFEAENVTGTEYARTETKDTHNMEATVPKGTQQHAYYFENGGKSIEIDYNLFPGDVDHTDDVVAVAKTLIFN
jgi:type II secretory pathway pseudopilin PulG